MFFVDFFLVDHSRVRLTTVDGIAGSDYINANFCDVSVTSGNYVSDKVLILLTAAYLQHPSQPKQNILFLFMGCYHETSNAPSPPPIQMSFGTLNNGYCHISRVIGKKMHTSPHKVTFRLLFTYLNIVFFLIPSILSSTLLY